MIDHKKSRKYNLITCYIIYYAVDLIFLTFIPIFERIFFFSLLVLLLLIVYGTLAYCVSNEHFQSSQ